MVMCGEFPVSCKFLGYLKDDCGSVGRMVFGVNYLAGGGVCSEVCLLMGR
jgi:hypothetical protein